MDGAFGIGTAPPLALQAGSAAVMLPDAGVYLVDKPAGPTSFRMVQHVRRALGIKKVGHAGTLDPFASGLLVICAGRPATREISRLMAAEKEYEAILHLGVETETQDPEGAVTAQRPVGDLPPEEIEKCLACFRGELLQAPPAYSAVKHEGKPLYHYARKGISIAKEPRAILIKSLEGRKIARDRLLIRVTCSKGTYIRTLAADIGRDLGCGAHLVALRRLRIGPFSVKDALFGNELLDRELAPGILHRYHLTVTEVLHKIERSEQTESSGIRHADSQQSQVHQEQF
jgi:tRNA pseudouridine55 synthase